MAADYGIEVVKELELLGTINSIEDVCKVWSKIRPILVTAQTILKLLYPPAAAAISLIIGLFDNVCPNPAGADASKHAALLKAHAELIAAWSPESRGITSPCQSRCKAHYDKEVAACGDDLDCVNAAFGRYVICTLGCRAS